MQEESVVIKRNILAIFFPEQENIFRNSSGHREYLQNKWAPRSKILLYPYQEILQYLHPNYLLVSQKWKFYPSSRSSKVRQTTKAKDTERNQLNYDVLSAIIEISSQIFPLVCQLEHLLIIQFLELRINCNVLNPKRLAKQLSVNSNTPHTLYKYNRSLNTISSKNT